jgi:outer membrane lipoprotein-sorting protein
MIDRNRIRQEPLDPVLEQAVDSIRRAAMPPMPPGVRAAAVARMQSTARQPRLVLYYERIRAMKPRYKLVAAASFLIAVGAAIALVAVMTACPAIAFADVKASIQNAKTVQMTMQVSVVFGANLPPVPTRMKMFVKEPGRRRMEPEDKASVVIYDMNQKKMLALDVRQKTAYTMDIGQLPVTGQGKILENPFEGIRKALDGTEKPLGQRDLDGKKARGFFVTKEGKEMEIWGDAATGQPLLIKMKSGGGGSGLPESTIILRDIVLDKELPDSLFSLQPPEGYTLKPIKTINTNVDGANLSEKDLVAGLRQFGEWNGGVFPEVLVPGVETVNHPERARKLGQLTEEQQLAMTQVMARMFVFIQQEQAHGFRYAGDGVKLGDASKPVAWWRSEGAKEYRVVLGDLTFADWPAEKLPATRPASQPFLGLKPGSVRLRITCPGQDHGLSSLRPPVTIRVEKWTSTQPSDFESRGVARFTDLPTSKKMPDMVVRVYDPDGDSRGQRLCLSLYAPVKFELIDSEAAVLAAVDNVAAGMVLTVEAEKPATQPTTAPVWPKLTVQLKDAAGQVQDITRRRP